MLRIDGLKLSCDNDSTLLREKAASVLRVPAQSFIDFHILRRSVDARGDVRIVYSVGVELSDEERVLRRCRSASVTRYAPEVYTLPARVRDGMPRPVVVGAGPAGLFCALVLSLCGAPPVLLERGQCVEQRTRDVARFWQTGELDTSSNVQFGEGGAGAFSDGKLNTGTRDVRHRFILEQLVSFGAPESILYDAKPHVGTDKLHITLRAMRARLLELGCDIRFGHHVVDITCKDSSLSSLTVRSAEGEYVLPCSHAVFALGHSARDTFYMLHGHGAAMERKAFSVGVRIEHRQSDIDAAQYKQYAGHPSLGAASYKLSCHLDSGRSVYSFCVCPGGTVVAAASEDGRLVTNGMSEYARDGENINGAILVNITPGDLPGDDVLAGVAFQRKLESDAFALGGGGYIAPAQLVGDFLDRRASSKAGSVTPTYRPAVRFCDLHDCLPSFVCGAISEALPIFERHIRGFACPGGRSQAKC
ncbi:MAG: hypothetical protein IJF15_02820 [Oscillospiraceae bacterium]|nr:hypothetical protein [Oscillospiraceae bacterium]